MFVEGMPMSHGVRRGGFAANWPSDPTKESRPKLKADAKVNEGSVRGITFAPGVISTRFGAEFCSFLSHVAFISGEPRYSEIPSAFMFSLMAA
jgi:hypothetical protein